MCYVASMNNYTMPTGKRTRHFSIRLEPTLLDLVKRAAEKRNQTTGAWVRDALERQVTRELKAA